jgi:hypothetical protein
MEDYHRAFARPKGEFSQIETKDSCAALHHLRRRSNKRPAAALAVGAAR